MSEIPPDTKDWTWTLERPCPECGFEAAAVSVSDLPRRVAAYTTPWLDRLSRADVRDRPTPTTWSPLEYAAHVRDVCALFTARTRLMLEEDDPAFANWDQDVTAVVENYAGQDPSVVATEVVEAGESYAALLAEVPTSRWERTGRRSNGSVFTVRTLGQYGLHDLAHHLFDAGIERRD